MPEYKVIGNTFFLGRGLRKREFSGPVVASRDAVYLLVEVLPSRILMARYGKFIGTLVAMAFPGAAKARYDARQFDWTDLPQAITSHPEWPATRREGPVIVIPRDVVHEIRYDHFGKYYVDCGDGVYDFRAGHIGTSGTIPFLNDCGWSEKLAGDQRSHLVRKAPFVGLCVGAIGGAVAGFLIEEPKGAPSLVPLLMAAGAIPGFVVGLVLRGVWPKKWR